MKENFMTYSHFSECVSKWSEDHLHAKCRKRWEETVKVQNPGLGCRPLESGL